MRTTLVALLAALVPSIAVAQINTTGTISPNTTVTQAQLPPTTGGTTPGGTVTGETTTGVTTPTATAAAPRDVAIVTCGQDFSTGTGQLLVFTASTSAGVPVITAGAQCAQGLSDLFVAGFGILDVLSLNQQIQYTLVR